MKIVTYAKSILSFLTLILDQRVIGGAFQNLDFESGTVPQEPPGELGYPAADLLPGWSVKYGDASLEWVRLHAYLHGERNVSLYGTFLAPPTFEGNFGLVLQGGPDGDGGDFLPVSVSQTGSIPDGSQSLIFRALIGSPTEISINGTSVPYYKVGVLPEDVVYAVDVRGYSGREVILSIINYGPEVFPGGVYIDSISFSSSIVVPEPSTWTLLGLGAALVAWRRTKLDVETRK